MKFNKRKNIKAPRKFSFNKKKVTFLIAGIFMTAQIYFMIDIVSSGAKLSVLEEQEKELASSIQSLNSEFISNSSLRKLDEKAEELGFIKTSETVYLNTTVDVAAKID